MRRTAEDTSRTIAARLLLQSMQGTRCCAHLCGLLLCDRSQASHGRLHSAALLACLSLCQCLISVSPCIMNGLQNSVDSFLPAAWGRCTTQPRMMNLGFANLHAEHGFRSSGRK